MPIWGSGMLTRSLPLRPTSSPDDMYRRRSLRTRPFTMSRNRPRSRSMLSKLGLRAQCHPNRGRSGCHTLTGTVWDIVAGPSAEGGLPHGAGGGRMTFRMAALVLGMGLAACSGDDDDTDNEDTDEAEPPEETADT